MIATEFLTEGKGYHEGDHVMVVANKHSKVTREQVVTGSIITAGTGATRLILSDVLPDAPPVALIDRRGKQVGEIQVPTVYLDAQGHVTGYRTRVT